jgi:hypothetical protein
LNTLKKLLQSQGVNFTSIIVVRPDGQIVMNAWSDHQLDGHNQMKTLGALISGSWQAAMEASRVIGAVNEMEFRFSFENSESGLHIIPLNIDSDTWFLCMTFNHLMNPAFAKTKLRLLKNEIVDVVQDYINSIKENNKTAEKNVFKDLRDAEIDDVFSRIRI